MHNIPINVLKFPLFVFISDLKINIRWRHWNEIDSKQISITFNL